MSAIAQARGVNENIWFSGNNPSLMLNKLWYIEDACFNI